MTIESIKLHIYKYRVIYVVFSILIIIYLNETSKKNKKIVVFDLDETLGYFSELSLFCNGIEMFIERKMHFEEITHIFDLFPEFFRPYILNCLEYLKEHKTNNDLQVMIYTNNNGTKKWVNTIKDYLEFKLKFQLFDKVIGTYKFKNKVIEPLRTTFEKTLSDFKRVVNIKGKVDVCFIDNMYHDKMKNSEVFYIQCEDYRHSLPWNMMINRFLKATPYFIQPEYRKKFRDIMVKIANKFPFEKMNRTNQDMKTSEQLVENVKDFIEGRKFSGEYVRI